MKHKHRLRNWFLWKMFGKQADQFIKVHCQALVDEFADIEYLKFKVHGREYDFKRTVPNN